ncbi:MAG: amidohydrolase family protein [Chitinophagales bacterium]|nr:amidohydrolase family protein [Chitinophagales bacterium]
MDKVTFGTDYPFPLGDLSYGKFISEENNFSNEEIIKIFSANTLNWLKLN